MPLRPQHFVSMVALALSVAVLCSLFFFFGDFSRSDVATLRRYQMEKLSKVKDEVEIVVLGDSSAGNAIDAKLFSTLAGHLTLNLALVGTFGLSSDYNLVRFLSTEAKKLKVVIFMHSLAGWRAGFSKEGYFETLRYAGFPEDVDPLFPSRLDYLLYALNFKATLYGLRANLLHETSSVTVDDKSDYVVQAMAKYSNGLRHFAVDAGLPTEVNVERVHLYGLLNELCLKKRLVCIYAHGPLHDTIFQNSTSTIERINKELLQAKTILPITKVFHFGDAYFGDSEDHIDPTYKDDVTKEYFAEVQKILGQRK